MFTVENIVELIVKAGVVEDIEKFDPEKTFKENKIDSLDILTVFLAVEEQFGLKLSSEESENINSVIELLQVLNSK